LDILTQLRNKEGKLLDILKSLRDEIKNPEKSPVIVPECFNDPEIRNINMDTSWTVGVKEWKKFFFKAMEEAVLTKHREGITTILPSMNFKLPDSESINVNEIITRSFSSSTFSSFGSHATKYEVNPSLAIRSFMNWSKICWYLSCIFDRDKNNNDFFN